jgi:hypothetical protein
MAGGSTGGSTASTPLTSSVISMRPVAGDRRHTRAEPSSGPVKAPHASSPSTATKRIMRSGSGAAAAPAPDDRWRALAASAGRAATATTAARTRIAADTAAMAVSGQRGADARDGAMEVEARAR